jgi:hypothetical protein
MRKIITSTILTALASSSLFSQNVGIGTATPSSSAKLEISSANSGLLIPRVALTATNAAGPVTAPATSLLVYNTATAGVSPNIVTPGYYFWTGSAWSRLLNTASSDWTLLGNAGTVAGTNFIGTTDAVDFVTRTNNAERMRVTSAGNVGIGTSTPGYRLDLANGTFAFGSSNVRTETRDNAGLQGNAGAQSGFFETASPVNYPSGASSWWHLIDARHSNNGNNYALQIAGSFFDQELWFRKTNGSATQAWTRLLTSTNGWGTTGNSGTVATTNFIGTNDAVDFVTRTGNIERMRVTSGGNVGVGIAVPTQKFDIQGGNARINNTFIGDVGHGANWAGFANSSSANTTGYALLQSTTGDYTLINKQNTGSGYIGFRIANNDVAVITNAGNMGIGTTATNDKLYVTENQLTAEGDGQSTIYSFRTRDSQNDGTGYGISLTNNAMTGYNFWGDLYTFGVHGASYGDYTRTGGVLGSVSSTSAWGVLGYKTSGSTFFGVYGSSGYGSGGGFLPTSEAAGVGGGFFGDLVGSVSKGSIIGQLNSGELFAQYNSGNMYTLGKNIELVETESNVKVPVYSVTSTEATVYSKGNAKLNNGEVYIAFDAQYKSLLGENPVVTVSPTANCNGLYISSIDKNGFTVKELMNGVSSATFAWIAVGNRIDNRMDAATKLVSAPNFDRNVQQVLFNDDNKDGKAEGIWWNGSEIQFGEIPAHLAGPTKAESK